MAEKKPAPIKNTPKKSGHVIPLFSLAGMAAGEMALPVEIFAVTASDRLLAQYVRVYLANQRQATNTVKTRGEVTGSTRKIYKQKGTGRARHGAKSAPIFVGGGKAHGPRLHSFKLKLNKKQRQKALYSSLSLALKRQDIMAVDGAGKIDGKTKQLVGLLGKLKLDDYKKVLFVYSFGNKESGAAQAIHNLPGLRGTDARLLNAYDVLRSQKILFTKASLEDFIAFRGFSPTKKS